LGTIEDVQAEVREVVRYLGNEGGYIFNSTHNITAEISPEKIIAMYKAASDAG
jgi:uroporphyrinogen decarboxylase